MIVEQMRGGSRPRTPGMEILRRIVKPDRAPVPLAAGAARRGRAPVLRHPVLHRRARRLLRGRDAARQDTTRASPCRTPTRGRASSRSSPSTPDRARSLRALEARHGLDRTAARGGLRVLDGALSSWLTCADSFGSSSAQADLDGLAPSCSGASTPCSRCRRWARGTADLLVRGNGRDSAGRRRARCPQAVDRDGPQRRILDLDRHDGRRSALGHVRHRHVIGVRIAALERGRSGLLGCARAAESERQAEREGTARIISGTSSQGPPGRAV